jgi:hypothetical protein
MRILTSLMSWLAGGDADLTRGRRSFSSLETRGYTVNPRIASQTPAGNIEQLIELSCAPTDAWRDLVRVRAAQWCLRD